MKSATIRGLLRKRFIQSFFIYTHVYLNGKDTRLMNVFNENNSFCESKYVCQSRDVVLYF